MAKGRKRRNGRPAAQDSELRDQVSGPEKGARKLNMEGRFTIAEYIVAILVFWLFILVQALVTWLWTGETIGMTYFFGSLGIGFTVVAILSWLHDVFYQGEQPEDDDCPA